MINTVSKLYPRVKNLRARKFGYVEIIRFLFNSCTSPLWKGNAAFKTPENITLDSKEDFAHYISIFANNCYHTEIWGGELKSTPAAIVLDLGANKGFFTALCLTFNHTAQVFCFDMYEGLRPYINQHIQELGGKNCEIIVSALTDTHNGFVTVNAENIFNTGNTLYSKKSDVEVEVSTLHLESWYSERRFVNSPLIVKMDIEGAERTVIPSNLKILTKAKYLIIEFHESRRLSDLLLPTHEILVENVTSPSTCVIVFRKR